MSRPVPLTDRVASECVALTAPAEQAFTSRWRMSTLKRIEPDLYEALVDQKRLYDIALITGTDTEAREQASAMVRGWKAACARLEAPLQPDDAYFVGLDGRTGTYVVIGDHPASAARVQAHPRYAGVNAVFMTPDEVAAIVAGMQTLSAVKLAFPDAEVIEMHPAAA